MKPRRFGFLERAAETFDLPADALAGLPKVELVGDGELRAMTGVELLITGTITQISLA